MAKAAEPGASNKTLEKVVKQLEAVNTALEEQNARDDVLIGFEQSSGLLGKIARHKEAQKQKSLEKNQKDGVLAAKNSLTVAQHQDKDSHKSKSHLKDLDENIHSSTELAENLETHTIEHGRTLKNILETGDNTSNFVEAQTSSLGVNGRALMDLVDLSRDGNQQTSSELAELADQGEDQIQQGALFNLFAAQQQQELATLVDQGEDQIEFAEDAAAAAAEAAREAARKGDEEKEFAVTLVMPEEEVEMSLGVIIAAISGALLGAVAGLAIGFVKMWGDIFKFIGKTFTKIFPNTSKMLGDIFGKGGKISKFFASIKAFFTESKAFKVMDDLITKGKAAITKVMKPIKATFTAMKAGWTSMITKIKSWIKMIMDPIDDLKKLLGMGGDAGKAAKSPGKFLKIFKGFFDGFKKIFAKIMWPLQIIISLFEGGMEAKDAVEKSTSLPASIFNAIIGFVGGVLDGLIFGMLDLIKGAISWIAGFLGFKDVEATLDSFSFSKMWNEFLDDIYEWFNLLFEDPVKALTNLVSSIFGGYLDLNSFILDMVKMPLVWLMELFGWDDAAAATESFSLSGWVMEKWDKVVAWITGLFAWGKKAGATEEGGWSFLTFVDSIWTSVKDWLTGLFTFASDKVETAGFAISTFISDVFKGIKEWFGSMFKFDSTSDLLSTVLNIMMWLPNLFVKAVAGITSWFAGLLGFKEESKELAKAGKEFNFGDLIMKAVKAIGKWFGDLFDDIVNFDFKSLAKSIMPDFLANLIFGDEPEAEKTAETKKTEQKVAGGEAEKALEKPDTEGMFAAILNPFRTYVKDLLAETPLIPDWVENIVLGAIPGGEVTGEGARGGIIKSRAAKGAIVTKPAYLPSSGTVVGEHSSWSGKGAAGGAIPDGPGGEAIIPLAGQAGGKILAEALAAPIAGAILNALMMARAGGAGAEGGGAPTVIQDNSTNTNVTNNTVVRSPSPSGPGLHFEGRDFVHKIA